jgi:hypothetical protein
MWQLNLSSSKLPRVNTVVLVCCQIEEQQWIGFAALTRNDFKELRWYDSSGFDLTYVTHWQKFVYPKKEKNENKNNIQSTKTR